MHTRRVGGHIGLIFLGLASVSCGIQDLKEDLDNVREKYGYLKGHVANSDAESDILVALLRNDNDNVFLANVRAVTEDESFYILVPDGSYTLVAFADISGDFAYQVGEPAEKIDSPTINWFSSMKGQDRVDTDSLQKQEIELSRATILDQDLDLSLEALRKQSNVAKNFLRVVSWDDGAFSAKNTELGIWQPGEFQEQVGFGLYVLKEFDPDNKTIVLVHGINDSPRVFESMVNAIPEDYQVLLFHYPSSFSLEYTSYVLAEALDELTRRFDLPQLNIIAHSMGGLVGKGTIYQADAVVKGKLDTFISLASPYGGHSAAAAGIKWAPVVAPVWWAMAPGSDFLQKIDSVDLTDGPIHHLFYTYSRESGGAEAADDGVVTVESQLAPSARRNAVAIYGVADNHVGVMSNACVQERITKILAGEAVSNQADC